MMLIAKDNRTLTWEDICVEFNRWCKYNTEVDVTKKELETTKQ